MYARIENEKKVEENRERKKTIQEKAAKAKIAKEERFQKHLAEVPSFFSFTLLLLILLLLLLLSLSFIISFPHSSIIFLLFSNLS